MTTHSEPIPSLPPFRLPEISHRENSISELDLDLYPVVRNPPEPDTESLSVLEGPLDPPLLDLTLPEVLSLQAYHHGDKEFLIFPWTGARWSFARLQHESFILARAMFDIGIRPGDRVGIMAGNCEHYAAVFFAAVRLGAILVILNNTYTKEEARFGLGFTECKLFFTTACIGRLDNRPLIDSLLEDEEIILDDGTRTKSPQIVILRGLSKQHTLRTYTDMMKDGNASRSSIFSAEMRVSSHDVCNLQFTSGTTGRPKAAMLTHHNLVNNSRFIAHRLGLTSSDILCCPPPLFHCFGLVLGLLACLSAGTKVVYPAETFDAPATLAALVQERCTALHGVPTMIDSLISLVTPQAQSQQEQEESAAASWQKLRLSLRTGIIAGSPLPPTLLSRMTAILGMQNFTPSYGLTEASPTIFNSFPDDPLSLRLGSVGRLLPHISAKLVNPSTGSTVPIGERGELYIAGYQVMAGYWNNPGKTAETITVDKNGTRWLHTGDECIFLPGGYCRIVGRYKDIIIKGGENIYPAEIEDRLVAHESISRAVVVGVRDKRYGEVVGAFLERNGIQLNDEDIREWVRMKLGRHKAPTHVFWLGEKGVPSDLPLTGSGKVKKYEMAKVANNIVSESVVAKL